MFNVDNFYMQQALMLAKRGKLTVSPNPMVGCIIVNNGKIVGEGFHVYKGGQHAEIKALYVASENSKNATVYITLEPCCLMGNTPPCTQALIKAGIKKVIISTLDPNPKITGNGVKILKEHGIKVKIGILEESAQLLNKIFFHYHTIKRPYVIAKWGMSIDGKMKVKKGDNKSITNDVVKIKTHNLRNMCDAIIVGANTVINDNPMLNVRHTEASKINQPIRIIISRYLNIPIHSKIFNTDKISTIIFTTKHAKKRNIQKLIHTGNHLYILNTNERNEIPICSILNILAQIGITSVLVEGGPTLHGIFFKENMVDAIYSFIAPVIINGYKKKQYINKLHYSSMADNSVFASCLIKSIE